ncbi:MAG: hypothetical protein IPM39_19980 [Chloroflexi bacterium]|nr:hypothetical protein [Chloroflexota bacterium]
MNRLILQLFSAFIIVMLIVAIWPETETSSQPNDVNRAIIAATAVPTPIPTLPPTPQPLSVSSPASLQPGQSHPGDGFGQAIAVDGTTAVIGAPQANNGQGAVTIFTRQGGQWRETAHLTASDGAANDNFGRAVAISGQTILVGASGHSAARWQAGAAYVFQFSNGRWQQTAKLLPGSAQDIRFGWSVALDGDTAVVGAPYRYQGEMLNVGSATIFTRQGPAWQQQARLTSGLSGGAVGSDLFGWAVAIRGSSLVVGAYLNATVYSYEFTNGQWRQTAMLRDGTGGNQFGYSVALSQNSLVVGAPAANVPVNRGGTAVLFTRQSGGSWTEAARLAPEGLRPGSRFGWSVALDGGVLVVGMRESEGRSDVEESGGAFAFRITNGQTTGKAELYAPVPAPFAHMGTAVATANGVIFAGAPGQRDTPGVVTVFALNN